jgi:aconitate hydratase
VRVVLVKSFARIHETNLKSRVCLPLPSLNKSDYDLVREDDLVDVLGMGSLSWQSSRDQAEPQRRDHRKIPGGHTFNENEIGWLEPGLL